MLKVQEQQPVEFSSTLLSEADEIIKRYPKGKHKSALLPILHLVQAELGWTSVPAMDKVAEILNIENTNL